MSDESKRDHPDVPWPKIVGMRNILVHHYFGIDPEAVWQVVEKDLPELRQKLTALINRM